MQSDKGFPFCGGNFEEVIVITTSSSILKDEIQI